MSPQVPRPTGATAASACTSFTGLRSLVLLLIIHTSLLAYSAHIHSPTLNEPGHLVAGLSYWKFRTFELFRNNPPLVRMTAALPVMAVGYEQDWSRFSSYLQRAEYSVGEDFVIANGERSYYLFMIARLACIPFSWIGAIVCYLWARDLFGGLVGVAASALWCFSPNIVGHGALITADVHAAALGLAACYTFWKWLKNPTWVQTAVTGVVLGVAELAKTTLIVFYPLWPLLWLLYRLPSRHTMRAKDWIREAGMLAVRMAIGILIINAGYGFEGSFTRLDRFYFISDLFAGRESPSAEQSESSSVDQELGATSTTDTASDANEAAPASGDAPLLAEDAETLGPSASIDNRFADTWIGRVPVPFPSHYILGIDFQQRDFENFALQSYLRGNWQDKGWWYYYLYAVALKIPLGTWTLAGLALAARICRVQRGPRWNDELILLAPMFVIFAVVSSKTGFSHHMRYVYPAFPFFFIWVSQIARLACADSARTAFSTLPFVKKTLAAVATIALAWSVGSSVYVYPHCISYFNELASGPRNGTKHLLFSSIDWGQDLRYVESWMNRHQEQAVHLAYYGPLAPSSLGIIDDLRWPSQMSSVSPESGYYVISANLLYGARWPARGGGGNVARLREDLLETFRDTEPEWWLGYSIVVFDYRKESPSVGD